MLTQEQRRELVEFMSGPDMIHLVRFINYFSFNGRYLKPAELKEFWDSLAEDEKNYYRVAIWHVKFA